MINRPLKELVYSWFQGKYFTLRAGYYSGRGPNLGDLNSKILETIYQGLKKDVGPTEARNFVRFVNQLNDLSASAFIVAFEEFWAKGCKIVEIQQSASDGNKLDAHGDALVTQAFAMVENVQRRSSRPGATAALSVQIKYGFIMNHNEDIPEDEKATLEYVVRSVGYDPDDYQY